MYAGRLAIIVSNNRNNTNSTVVEIVYFTTLAKQKLPTHVSIENTKKMSAALCEQVTGISVDRLSEYLCRCTNLELKHIDISLAISFGIKYSSFTTVSISF